MRLSSPEYIVTAFLATPTVLCSKAESLWRACASSEVRFSWVGSSIAAECSSLCSALSTSCLSPISPFPYPGSLRHITESPDEADTHHASLALK